MEGLSVALMIVFGIGLVVLEIIFIPGTTVVGVIGFAFMCFGIYLGYEYFNPTTGTVILISTFIVNVVILVVVFRSRAWEKFSLKNTSEGKANEPDLMEIKEGDIGETVSSLRPVGKAEFNNKEYEVTTLGNYVSSGTKVKIIKISGNKIIIETT
ncbi:MAG: hypothetical protein OEW75_10790 [Cyclobacteriaceae bacterium]|nr:hypothetical protein [Cyclobacteriaceae bacterium]